MAEPHLPTPALLRQLLDYDPSTGAFIWKRRDPSLFRSETASKIWNSRWPGQEAFSACANGYKVGQIFGVSVAAHRVAWAFVYGEWPIEYVDHINGIRDDNRISNLRQVSHKENCRNSRTPLNNTSGFTGVSWCKRSAKWYAYITVDGRMRSLGLYSHRPDAVAARNKANAAFGFHKHHGRRPISRGTP